MLITFRILLITSWIFRFFLYLCSQNKQKIAYAGIENFKKICGIQRILQIFLLSDRIELRSR